MTSFDQTSCAIPPPRASLSRYAVQIKRLVFVVLTTNSLVLHSACAFDVAFKPQVVPSFHSSTPVADFLKESRPPPPPDLHPPRCPHAILRNSLRPHPGASRFVTEIYLRTTARQCCQLLNFPQPSTIKSPRFFSQLAPQMTGFSLPLPRYAPTTSQLSLHSSRYRDPNSLFFVSPSFLPPHLLINSPPRLFIDAFFPIHPFLSSLNIRSNSPSFFFKIFTFPLPLPPLAQHVLNKHPAFLPHYAVPPQSNQFALSPPEIPPLTIISGTD